MKKKMPISDCHCVKCLIFGSFCIYSVARVFNKGQIGKIQPFGTTLAIDRVSASKTARRSEVSSFI